MRTVATTIVLQSPFIYRASSDIIMRIMQNQVPHTIRLLMRKKVINQIMMSTNFLPYKLCDRMALNRKFTRYIHKICSLPISLKLVLLSIETTSFLIPCSIFYDNFVQIVKTVSGTILFCYYQIYYFFLIKIITTNKLKMVSICMYIYAIFF